MAGAAGGGEVASMSMGSLFQMPVRDREVRAGAAMMRHTHRPGFGFARSRSRCRFVMQRAASLHRTRVRCRAERAPAPRLWHGDRAHVGATQHARLGTNIADDASGSEAVRRLGLLSLIHISEP